MKENFYFLLRILSNYLFRFGEKPELMIMWIILIVVIFGANIYSFNSVAKSNLEQSSTKERSSLSIVISSSVNEKEIEANSINDNFKNSLYVSLVTFTTLGFGDYRPWGWCKLYLAAEALIGAIMLALLVLTLGRRTAGR